MNFNKTKIYYLVVDFSRISFIMYNQVLFLFLWIFSDYYHQSLYVGTSEK